MNPTEIADALDALAKAPFDPGTFGFSFAEATDSANATVSKLKAGKLNRSDLPDGVLLNGKFHYAPATPGEVPHALDAVRGSKRTAKGKPVILIATDGETVSAENTKSKETLHCAFSELGKEFAFFLPVAGKERYRAAEENPVDIAATGKLAKLYDALIRHNPDWAGDERRHVMNLFMTRLIFCLFSEDVGIFREQQFSKAVFTYSGNKGEDAAAIIATAFRAMNLPKGVRDGLPDWAEAFDYVNGGLFADEVAVPAFSPMAFRYLRDAADLDWREINPDIFGSMIQAIADPKARAELGMHYTSVPNIMKVLGPLFLDDLDSAIDKAWEKSAMLRAVLARLSRIRVFDPACGSGNFLVVAYREMRDREIRILKRLSEIEGKPTLEMFSAIGLGQFHGIEIADFAAETAKLSLFIAEYQANARFADVFGRMPALLPLQDGGHIVCDNALRVNWEDVCPPPAEDEEVYIAGNPPFLGKAKQEADHKADMDYVFKGKIKNYRALDYVSAWYFKASIYIRNRRSVSALVATNSICQGASANSLWPFLVDSQIEIGFAHRSFQWRNNASANAAVICVIVGIRNISSKPKRIFQDSFGEVAENINAYLLDYKNIYVNPRSRSIFMLPHMSFGCMPYDNGALIMTRDEMDRAVEEDPISAKFIRKFKGSQEVVKGIERYCIWIDEDDLDAALSVEAIRSRVEACKSARLAMKDKAGKALAKKPHQFREHVAPDESAILVPGATSERRPYLPVEKVGADVISSNLNQVLYDAPDWCLAIIASRLHLVWIATVCGKLKSDFRYSNTLGWNTFPVPKFTEEQKAALDVSANRILKTRYEHYPKTIAELYDPDRMPDDLRQVHRENDELLETMYIGRSFRNDTERLERLFKLYAARVREA